jgi:hypothetical protein
MCLSAQADLVGGLLIGAIGVDAVRHVGRRHDHLPLAALPLILAFHQLDEAFVWWGLQGHVAESVGRVATWIYLLIAFVLLPVYVPVAVACMEPAGRRRRAIVPLVALGVVVSIVLFAAMVAGPVTAELGDYHVNYDTGLRSGGFIVLLYVVATCGSLLFSGFRDVALFGIVNLVAVVVLARLTIDGFASLWCAWAAVASAAFALWLRFGRAYGPGLARVT